MIIKLERFLSNYCNWSLRDGCTICSEGLKRHVSAPKNILWLVFTKKPNAESFDIGVRSNGGGYVVDLPRTCLFSSFSRQLLRAHEAGYRHFHFEYKD
jgi:hypothetical protein